MGQKTIREISVAWKEYKQPYVKQSTMAAYVAHLGESYSSEFWRKRDTP